MNPILLTGFRPFGGEQINPSEMLLGQFSSNKRIKTLLLPVSYRRSFELLKSVWDQGKYQYVIMLGQAGGRAKVGLERFSVNLMDAEIPDEDGLLPREQKIDIEGETAIQVELPLRDWLTMAKARNLPLEISNTAGTYVCNYLSYRVAQELTRLKVKSLFIHLPYLTEQTKGKPTITSSLTLKEMQSCVELILEQILGS